MAALAVLWGWFSANLIFYPGRLSLDVSPRAYGLPFEKVEFPAEDGVRLAGWWVPGKGKAAVIVCHGFGANRADVLDGTLYLHRAGFHLLYFDFRNHGESEVAKTTLGIREVRDVTGALNWVKRVHPDEARRVGLLGFSMGAAVALVAGGMRPEVDAVVADTSYATFSGIVARFAKLFYHIPRYPFIPVTVAGVGLRTWSVPDRYSPLRWIGRISPRPVLLLHGGSDTRILPETARQLLEAARDPRELWLVPGADHIEGHSVAPREYEEKVVGFLVRALSR